MSNFIAALLFLFLICSVWYGDIYEIYLNVRYFLWSQSLSLYGIAIYNRKYPLMFAVAEPTIELVYHYVIRTIN